MAAANLEIDTTITANGNDEHNAWSPLYGSTFNPPGTFSQQIADPNSPLYLNNSQPNALLTFPPDSPHGMAKFLGAMGVLPEHAFGTCLAIFLIIVASMVAISGLIALIGWSGSAFAGKPSKSQSERKDATENNGM